MLTNVLEYKGYHARIGMDLKDGILVGSVFGINDSLNFHGETVTETVEMFHQSIDNYLAFCEEVGKEPEKEFSGTFNVRIGSELHRKLAGKAYELDRSLNSLIEEAVAEYCQE